MRKYQLNGVLVVIVILFVLLSGCSSKSVEVNDADTNKGIKYVSKKFGFSLNFPRSWEGKYWVSEGKIGITVFHKFNGEQNEKAELFSILLYGTEEDWSKLVADEDAYNSAPFERIGVINGNVFIETTAGDYPYDETEKDKSTEYDEMGKDVDGIISTFRDIN